MDLNNTNLSLCRVCLCQNVALKSIFTLENFSERTLQVKEVMIICASVQVDISDGLPQGICAECLRRLREVYAFKNLCEQTDFTLRNNLALTIKSEEEDEPPDIEQVNITDDLKYENIGNVGLIDDVKENDFDALASTSSNSTSQPKVTFLLSSYPSSNLLQHKKLLYTCEICNQCYTAKQDFENHKKTHSMKKPYMCNMCGNCFDAHSKMDRHKKQDHAHTNLGKIRFRCIVPTCLYPSFYTHTISDATYKQKHFFRAPANEKNGLWREKLKSVFPQTHLTKYFRICEDHFLEKDFTSTLRTQLHRKSVPSIFNLPS